MKMRMPVTFYFIFSDIFASGLNSNAYDPIWRSIYEHLNNYSYVRFITLTQSSYFLVASLDF